MAAQGGKRVAALVRADVVGSTSHLASHGLEASLESRSRVLGLIRDAAVHGQVLETLGDGATVAFASATSGLAAAWQLQQSAQQTLDLSLRVAVIITEIDTAGEWSNDAELRLHTLESSCEPGSVAVDGSVMRSVRGIAGFDFSTDLERHDPQLGHRLNHVPSTLPSTGTTELRAVLASDIVSAGADDVALAIPRTVSEHCIEAHDGTVVDSNSGGNIAFFPTARQALAAAQDMHDRAASSSLHSTVGTRFGFAIGISSGDVVVSGEDRFGMAVVEAARLVDLAREAAPGSPPTTLVSVDVAELAGGLRPNTPRTNYELKGIPGVVEVAAIEAPVDQAARFPLPPGLSRTHPFPLAGRNEPLDRLEKLWAQTLLGNTGAAVVSGEEGVGKTRLVQELARIAQRSGAMVLHGVFEDDLRVPYAPIATALSRVDPLDEQVVMANSPSSGPLRQLLTPRAEAQASPGRSFDFPDQFALFDAVASAVRELSVLRPVLLVIDDLQWADTDTVRMIERVFASNGDGRIAIVATCRAEALDRAHPAHELLQATTADHAVDHIQLERLETQAVVEMLASTSGAPAISTDRAVADKLRAITGGSPLYLEELVAHLSTTGALSFHAATGWKLDVSDGPAVPNSIIELMARRASRLGDDAVDVLSAAAVMGATFDLEVLAAVTDRSMSEIIDLVELASTARLVSEGDHGICAFGDELAREALLRELRPSRRAALHEQVATKLEQLRPKQIDRLAAHWSAALGGMARTKAIHYLQLAGERDMATAAWESSVERHRRVLSLLDVEETEDTDRGELHYAVGMSLRKIGDATYRPELTKAADLARSNQDGGLLAKCAIAMMRPGAWYPEADMVDTEIVEICEDALLLLAADDPRRPRVLAALAVNLTYGSEIEDRMALVVEAQQLAQATGDLAMYGTTLAAELIAFHEPDRFERRRSLAEEVRRIGRATGERDLLFAGSWFLVMDLIATGEITEAERLVDELTVVVAESREYWPSFVVAHFPTAMAIARCDDDAADLIEAERLAFELQPVDWFGVSVIQHAAIAVGHGTLSDMLLSLVAAADEHGSDDWAVKWNYALSRAYLDAGDHEAAMAAIAMNPDLDPDYYWLSSTYHLGLLGLQTGNAEICERVIDLLSPYRGRISMIGLGACLSGQVSTALGQAYLGLRDLDTAEACFREAMEQAQGLSFHYFATQARRFLAQTLLQRDPTSLDARQLVDQVLASSERYNFSLEKREAQRLLDAKPSVSSP